jgi:Holliday junction resolvase RusA-like endonuclease
VSMSLSFYLTAGWGAPRGIKDVDNLCKTVLDALNRIGYRDDRQVVHLRADVVRGSDDPFTLIALEGHELEEQTP